MMIHSIDKNNDWTYNQYKFNVNALTQNIKTKLQEWVSDCFFNLPTGIDWLNRLTNPTALDQQNMLIAEVQALLLKIDGVVEVINTNATFNRKTRLLSVTYTVNTVFTTSISDVITQNL